MGRGAAGATRPKAQRSAPQTTSQLHATVPRRDTFSEQIQQRERELQQQLDRLLATRAQLEQEEQSIAAENAKLDVREQELDAIEAEFADQERRMSRITTVHKSATEIERHTTNLQKTMADLQQQLAVAQTELEEAVQRVRYRTAEPPESAGSTADSGSAVPLPAADGLSQTVQRKSAQVDHLTQLVDALQEDVIVRENEVIALEIAALEHQKAIEATNERRAALQQRRAAAEQKRKQILAAMADREERYRELLKEREEIKLAREAAEREKELLDREKHELLRKEELLSGFQQRHAAVNQIIESENQRQTRLQSERISLARRQLEIQNELRNDVDDFLIRYHEDEQAAERRYDRLEQLIDQRSKIPGKERQTWITLWTQKNQKSEEMIRQLEEQLAETDAAALVEQLNALEAEENELKEKIAQEEELIKRGIDQDEKERLEQLEKEMIQEEESLLKQQAELTATAQQQLVEDNDLEIQETELKMKVQDVKTKMRVLGLRERAAQKLLGLYQSELEKAEQTCEKLRKTTSA
jgi:hypothetical protein